MTKLHSFGGEGPPEGLERDLLAIARLPERARARFWEILGPTLGEDPIPPQVERKLDVFCADLEVAPDLVAPGLRAARSLVRGAARHAVAKAGFAEDLARLGCPPPIASMLLGGFDSAVGKLRKQAAIRDIGAHGKLLTGVDWRIDRILDTSRVKALGVDVLLVSLRFSEGGKEKTITLQVLPDMLDELRRVGLVD